MPLTQLVRRVHHLKIYLLIGLALFASATAVEAQDDQSNFEDAFSEQNLKLVFGELSRQSFEMDGDEIGWEMFELCYSTPLAITEASLRDSVRTTFPEQTPVITHITSIRPNEEIWKVETGTADVVLCQVTRGMAVSSEWASDADAIEAASRVKSRISIAVRAKPEHSRVDRTEFQLAFDIARKMVNSDSLVIRYRLQSWLGGNAWTFDLLGQSDDPTDLLAAGAARSAFVFRVFHSVVSIQNDSISNGAGEFNQRFAKILSQFCNSRDPDKTMSWAVLENVGFATERTLMRVQRIERDVDGDVVVEVEIQQVGPLSDEIHPGTLAKINVSEFGGRFSQSVGWADIYRQVESVEYAIDSTTGTIRHATRSHFQND